MRCQRCESYCGRSDNFCRGCGLSVREARLPMKVNAQEPAIWQGAAPVIAKGVAAVAIGAAAEIALRSLAKNAFRLPALLLSSQSKKSKRLPVRSQDVLSEEDGYAVSETVVVRRRSVSHR